MEHLHFSEISFQLKVPNFKPFFKKKRLETPKITINDVEYLKKIFKVPILFEEVQAEQFGWDGKFLRIKGLNWSGVCHEIAHFLLAPSYRKKMKDFGLGSGFNSKGVIKKVVSRDFSFLEEQRGCVLEWILLYNLKKSEYISSAMDDEYWDERDINIIKTHLKILTKKFGK